MKTPMKPSAHSIGVSNEMFPRQSVASQLKIFTPVGTAMIIELIMKKSRGRSAGRPRTCGAPRREARERDPDRRDRDRLVAEDRLAREDRDDLRDDPHRGQDHDVDLGVPEEPEDVLVEDRAAAVRRVEEVRAGVAVEQHHRQPGRERRQHEHEQPGVGEDRPDEERHPHPGHAGRAHVVDRDDEVDRAGERRDREDVQARGSTGPGRGPARAASRASRTTSSRPAPAPPFAKKLR